MFRGVSFNFYNVSVTSFSCIKSLQNNVNASITVKVLGGISFHVFQENLKHLSEGHTCFFVISCVLHRIVIESF